MAVRLLDLQLIYGVAGAREQFERLCALLIRSQFADAREIRVHRGDGGVDAYAGEWGQRGRIHVFQVKYFPTGLQRSQKQQIVESFDSCIRNSAFITDEWTLCLPIDLSTDETTWFENWASGIRHGVKIAFWGSVALETILFQETNQGIKEEFFKENYLQQIRETHSLIRTLAEEAGLRHGQSTRDSIRREMSNYLRNNMRIASQMIELTQEKRIPVVRYDLDSWNILGSKVLTQFPEILGVYNDVLGQMRHVNGIAAVAINQIREPQFTLGRFNSLGIGVTDAEYESNQFVREAIETIQGRTAFAALIGLIATLELTDNLTSEAT